MSTLQMQFRGTMVQGNGLEQVTSRQGCILSTSLFTSLPNCLGEHDGKVSIGGRNITNLADRDDTDALVEDENEIEALTYSLDKTCTLLYKMEISAEKTKLMENSANNIRREIKVK